MLALKSDYPEGTPWTNADYYEWKGGIFLGGYGCAGFAFMLSDAAFGDLPARQVYDLSDAENTVRVGDILRINGDTHSVIVMEADANGVTIGRGQLQLFGSLGQNPVVGRREKRRLYADSLQKVNNIFTILW